MSGLTLGASRYSGNLYLGVTVAKRALCVSSRRRVRWAALSTPSSAESVAALGGDGMLKGSLKLEKVTVCQVS